MRMIDLHRLHAWLGRYGHTMLRASLAVVLVWFGALKIVGRSPVEDLVVDTVPGADGSWFLPLFGGFEVALGLALLLGAFPLVIATLVTHLAGTFAVMATQPELAFQAGNPLLLTLEGEFVVKNLVLLTATLAIWGMSHSSGAGQPSGTLTAGAR